MFTQFDDIISGVFWQANGSNILCVQGGLVANGRTHVACHWYVHAFMHTHTHVSVCVSACVHGCMPCTLAYLLLNVCVPELRQRYADVRCDSNKGLTGMTSIVLSFMM